MQSMVKREKKTVQSDPEIDTMLKWSNWNFKITMSKNKMILKRRPNRVLYRVFMNYMTKYYKRWKYSPSCSSDSV